MIQVRVHTSGEAHFAGLEVRGHAELSAAGTDILCAAVSVLTENLGTGLRELLDIPLEIRKSKGFYSFQLEERYRDARTDLLFSSALLGIQILSDQYPGRLQLEY